MIVILKLYHWLRLSLLHFQVLYLSSAIHRADLLYHGMLSRAFFRVSVLEWRYSQGVKLYFAAKNQGGDDRHEF